MPLHPPIASTRRQCSNSTVGSVPSPFRNRDQEKDQNGVLASGWDLSLVVTCRSRISSSFTARQRGIHSPDGSNPYAFACVGTPSYQRSSKSPTGSVGDETGPSCDIFPGVVAYTTRFDCDSCLSCLSSTSYSQSTVSLLVVSKQGESSPVFPWYRRIVPLGRCLRRWPWRGSGAYIRFAEWPTSAFPVFWWKIEVNGISLY